MFFFVCMHHQSLQKSRINLLKESLVRQQGDHIGGVLLCQEGAGLGGMMWTLSFFVFFSMNSFVSELWLGGGGVGGGSLKSI